ncbi:MAG: phosphoribosylaminoimidazolesuccinocarboxamide synthase [Anaerolineales bacterium]|nr:phosphoribosylaminoimidazolesuccinocarboxamide synthase [Anaerolineales bacterium]
MLTVDRLRALLPQAFDHSGLPGIAAGKVREWYSLGDGQRVLITTDRLSAFDRILAAVPYKGQVLNQLAAWWFARTADIVPNHLLSLPDPNAALVREAEPFPVEVIVRGYITGVTSTALWYRYALGERDIYGWRLPDGLRKNDALPEALITPTTKGGPTGHDERLTGAEVVSRGLLDAATWDEVQAAALGLFHAGQAVAARAGLILVDTKYEFGRDAAGRVCLIDEVHTPDSSRFWRAESYTRALSAGVDPENFDKEFVRLAYAAQGYRGDGPPPGMPDDLWVAASQRYTQLYTLLTGAPFDPADYPVGPRLVANLRGAGLLTA